MKVIISGVYYDNIPFMSRYLPSLPFYFFTRLLGVLCSVHMDDVSCQFFTVRHPQHLPHSVQSRTFFHSFRLPGILQQRLELPFPLCCGKHNGLVRYKKEKIPTYQ